MPEEEQFSKNLGTKFGLVAALLTLGLFYLLFSSAIDQRSNPNSDPVIRGSGTAQEVVLQQNHYGHYVADGSINGQTVTFFLDTGATSIAIPEAIADELGLEKGASMQVNTANGIATAWMTRLDEVELGGLRIRNTRAHISPGFKSDEILLGMSFLSKFDFSQRGDQLILRQRGVAD